MKKYYVTPEQDVLLVELYNNLLADSDLTDYNPEGGDPVPILPPIED